MRRDSLDLGKLRLEPTGVLNDPARSPSAEAASTVSLLRGSKQPSTLR
jgi:hypothetical protein